MIACAIRNSLVPLVSKGYWRSVWNRIFGEKVDNDEFVAPLLISAGQAMPVIGHVSVESCIGHVDKSGEARQFRRREPLSININSSNSNSNTVHLR
ncbi:hypothetical protein N7481_012184 [Penicillium waksmanii]|uniref:uncharacterized protein n=1 Tax=Penicillium waksmanii TaxID=69791 RepID=UPI002547558D|nr:uncharacterized protein N7481_012184 [Penicillium waksmanii]KAJ5965470.1 hypothetical protein N7481_012184 [Penicillium waksmanii]